MGATMPGGSEAVVEQVLGCKPGWCGSVTASAANSRAAAFTKHTKAKKTKPIAEDFKLKLD
jgi:hypothetical protein